MHDDRPHVICPGFGGLLDEGEHGQSVLGHAHVRPLSVVVLGHGSLVIPPLQRNLGVGGRKHEVVSRMGHKMVVNVTLGIRSSIINVVMRQRFN